MMNKCTFFIFTCLIINNLFAQSPSQILEKSDSIQASNLAILKQILPQQNIKRVKKIIQTIVSPPRQDVLMDIPMQQILQIEEGKLRCEGCVVGFKCVLTNGDTVLFQKTYQSNANYEMQPIEKYFPFSHPIWKEYSPQDIAYIEVIGHYEFGDAKTKIPDKIWLFHLTSEIDRYPIRTYGQTSNCNIRYTINVFVFEQGETKPILGGTRSLAKL